jgi:hypothetical protein
MTDPGREASSRPDRWVLGVGLVGVVAWWGIEAAIHSVVFHEGSFFTHLVPQNTNEWWMRTLVAILLIGFAVYACLVINRIDRARQEQQRLQSELADALTKVLSGFLPICANCKKIHPDGADPECQSSWHSIESYLSQQTDLELSHGICPECADKLYGKRSP